MEPPNFSSYSLHDLLNNESFLKWVKTPNQDSDQFWQAAQVSYPALRDLISEARQLIIAANFQHKAMSEEEHLLLWQKIDDATSRPVLKGRVSQLWIRLIAAAMLTGIVLSIVIYRYRNAPITLETGYGQIKTFQLPDGSSVTLNANSHLRFNPTWSNKTLREVWIDGEGYFNVIHLHKKGHIAAHDRFIVHAKKVDVEVLGTTFNLTDRKNAVEVTLVTGRVKFDIIQKKSGSVIMYPGEYVHYISDLHKDTLVRKRIDIKNKIDWKNGILHFNQTPVTEVFEYVHDVYGYKTPGLRPEIAGLKLTGTFSNHNLDALILAISKTLNISIYKDSSTRQLTVK